jgi:hypothetical protein
MADNTAARMTAFKPGASPPPVEIAIRLIVVADCAIHTSSAMFTNGLLIRSMFDSVPERDLNMDVLWNDLLNQTVNSKSCVIRHLIQSLPYALSDSTSIIE